LNDPFWDIRLTAIEKAVKLDADNKLKALAILTNLATHDPNSRVRASALNYLASNLEANKFKELCLHCIAKDQSYLVLAAALKQLGKIDSELAILQAATLESERSSKLILGIAQLYGSYATKDKLYFFENALKGTTLQGFDQLGVINEFTYFISGQDTEQIEHAYELYAYLKMNGAYYTKLFIPQNINYLISMFDQKIGELEDQIAANKKNKERAHTDELYKMQKVYQGLKTKYTVLADTTGK
jgi:aminopeptidase N